MIHSHFLRSLLTTFVVAIAALTANAQQTQTHTHFSQCASNFPHQQRIDITKIDPKWKAFALCNKQFAVIYSGRTKTPILVIERLSAEVLRQAEKEIRTNIFYNEQRIPKKYRADLEDYRRSGYDRGHLAAAANQPSALSMHQSFSLSNIVPQDPHMNRKGAWVKVESDTRKFARRATGNVFVFSGPLFGKNPTTIGSSRVWVPQQLFKFVYDEHTQRSWAHILENSPTAKIGKPLTHDQFTEQTGWNLLNLSPNKN